MARLFVAREEADGEYRVAATPETVERLVGKGIEVVVARGAGEHAGWSDEAYTAVGATLGDDGALGDADIVVAVAPPSLEVASAMRRGAVLISFLAPHRQPQVTAALATAGVSALAMELVPRISRAQSIDALSSQANLSGYRAVIVAAYHLDKYFPLFMTAAGTIRPATIVVLGAGVAGLQAVATAKRLGAIVKVSDIREAAKAEVASLGASFIDVPDAEDLTDAGGYAKEVGEDFLTRQRAALTDAISSAHAVIATAQIPLRPAPRLVTAEMVAAMPAGAVLVDLAAADGGNCALTDPARIVESDGVTIIPGQDFPSAMPRESSALYARNITSFLDLIVGEDGSVAVNRDDEVVDGALATHDGQIVHDRVRTLVEERGGD
ncbi:MAG: NAD(P) transhydrogenase subunit alpha [Nitriliruptoraceae bacterium]